MEPFIEQCHLIGHLKVHRIHGLNKLVVESYVIVFFEESDHVKLNGHIVGFRLGFDQVLVHLNYSGLRADSFIFMVDKAGGDVISRPLWIL